MASIQKRGATWRASVVRRGVRRTATFDFRADAEAWAIRNEAEILGPPAPAPARAPDTPPPAPAPDRAPATVSALFNRYAREVSPTKASERWEKICLLALTAKWPVFAGSVDDLDAAAMAKWRDARLRQVSAHTVNRELNIISAVMNHAIKEWRLLTVNPVRAIKRPKNPPPRTQRVSGIERAAIAKQLGWDGKGQPAGAEQWIAWSFALALETAMRKGEVLSLTWQNLHLEESWLHLPKTKNGHPRDVPMKTAAVALFRLLDPPDDPGRRVVPVDSATFGTLFRRAKLAAKLPDIRFHDSRREATTVLAEKLGNVLELSAITGHRSLDILRRTYYRPNAADLAKKLNE